MKFLEKDLEEIIYDNSHRIDEKGLLLNTFSEEDNVRSSIFRQVNFGDYGTADLVNYEVVDLSRFHNNDKVNCPYRRRIIITVIECKLNTIDNSAFMQAQRYVYAIKQIIGKYNTSKTHFSFKTILIGDAFCSKGDFTFVYCNDPGCTIYTYALGYNGLQFEKVPKSWSMGSGKTNALKNIQEFKDDYKEYYEQYFIWPKEWQEAQKMIREKENTTEEIPEEEEQAF